MQLMKAEAIILKLTEGLKNNNTNNNITLNANNTISKYKIIDNVINSILSNQPSKRK